MNQDKTIEIVMATYNGEKYIKEQIESVINQTYTNWKLLIRDDNSRDKTIEIIKEYEKKDARIRLIKDNKGNLGFVKNFEELIKNSKEEYIMFSDQDDYWLENKLEVYHNRLNKLSEDDLKKPLLLHSNSFVCDKNLNIKKNNFIDSRLASTKNKGVCFFSYIVQGSTIMINKKTKNLCIPFMKKVTLHDRYFHLMVEFLGNRIFINKSLMKYRQHNNNEIGAKSNIIKKILTKRYFDENDRDLIIEINEKYKNKISITQLKRIEKYLKITDRTQNRFKRFFLSLDFSITLKKRVFLLLKG